MAFTDDQLEKSAEDALDRRCGPDRDGGGQLDPDERFARVMGSVLSQFTVFPKMTYALASIARNKLLEQTRAVAEKISLSVQALAEMENRETDYDLDSLEKAKEATERMASTAGTGSTDFPSQTRVLSEHLTRFLNAAAKNNRGPNPVASADYVASSVPEVAGELEALFDDLNYFLRHGEQLDFVDVEQKGALYILQNMQRLTENALEAAQSDESQQRMEEIILGVLTTQASASMLNFYQKPDQPYVKSAPVSGEFRDKTRAVPRGSDYRPRMVGDIDPPTWLTNAGFPYEFPDVNAAFVHEIEFTRNSLNEPPITESSLFPETEPVVGAFYVPLQKIVALWDIDPEEEVPVGGLTMITKFTVGGAEVVYVENLLAGTEVRDVLPGLGIPFGSQAHWHMGIQNYHRPALALLPGVTSMEILGVWTDTGTATTYINDAAEFLGWEVGQRSRTTYTAEEIAFLINDQFVDWDASVVEGFSDNREMGPYLTSFVESYQTPAGIADYDLIADVVPEGGEVLIRAIDDGSVEFLLAIPEQVAGWRLTISDGQNKGVYQLGTPGPETPPGSGMVKVWCLRDFNGFSLVLHPSEWGGASLNSQHLKIKLVDGYPYETWAEIAFPVAPASFERLGLTPSSFSYRRALEFIGPRKDASGVWRFDFQRGQVERGDVLRLETLGSLKFVTEANVIDSVVDSDLSSNLQDSIGVGRRLSLNDRVPSLPFGPELSPSEIDGEIYSYYRYWFRRTEEIMRRWRTRWLKGSRSVRWYQLLDRGNLLFEVRDQVASAKGKSSRVKLAEDLARTYVSLVGSFPLDLRRALQRLGVNVSGGGESTLVLEDVLLEYAPPMANSLTYAAAQSVLGNLEQNGYDRALDLLSSLKLPEFLNLAVSGASYQSKMEDNARRLISRIPYEEDATRAPDTRTGIDVSEDQSTEGMDLEV